jgi:hypothetical protein
LSKEISNAVKKLVNFFILNNIDYMIIGGYALSYYGRIRTTLDIDIALCIKFEEDFQVFLQEAEKAKYSPSLASMKNPVCILLDIESGLEFEIWTRPDGIEWDDETLDRRRIKRFDDFEVWVISPEDFIVNKLARPDRGVVDEQDVKSVLVRLQDTLDWEYLENRAAKAGVYSVLVSINTRANE